MVSRRTERATSSRSAGAHAAIYRWGSIPWCPRIMLASFVRGTRSGSRISTAATARTSLTNASKRAPRSAGGRSLCSGARAWNSCPPERLTRGPSRELSRWPTRRPMDSLPLSTSTQSMLSKAAEESSRLGHRFLGVEHVFAALSTAPDSSLGRALESQGVPLEEFLGNLIERIEPLEHPPWGMEMLVTPRCQRIIGLATRIAARNRKTQVTREHILEAIFREGRSIPMRLLRSRDIQLAELYEAIEPRGAESTDAQLPLLER